MRQQKKEIEFAGQIDNMITEFETAQAAKEIRRKMQKGLDHLQESLDYLRICIKYMVFDLEATKRENEYLRRLLKNGENYECD